MKDTELKQILNIPVATLSDWKRRDADNWRKLTYELLKSFSKEDLEKRLDAIKLLKDL